MEVPSPHPSTESRSPSLSSKSASFSSIKSPISPTKKPVFQFERIGSLVRKNTVTKKKEQEILTQFNAETQRVATPLSFQKSFDELDPDEYHLAEGEERRFLDPRSEKDPLVQELISTLKQWLNDELGDEKIRMKVSNLNEDLSDGLVYNKLIEKLSGLTLSMPTGELVQSEERQRRNVVYILNEIENILQLENQNEQEEGGVKTRRWSVESIVKGNLLSNLYLLLAIVDYYTRAGKVFVDLPKSALKVTVVSVAKKNGLLIYEKLTENLISGFLMKRDGFDTLIDHNPEKLQYVKQSLLQFANFHLGKLGRTVSHLDKDFADGVNFILLIGQLEGFYVPLYDYHLKPTTQDECLSNNQLVFELLSDFGGFPSRNRTIDLVRGDLKAILRVLFGLYVRYQQKNRKSNASFTSQDE